MSRVIQVIDAAAASAYLNANPDLHSCYYLEPFVATVDGKTHTGWENQGYSPTRVYVHR